MVTFFALKQELLPMFYTTKKPQKGQPLIYVALLVLAIAMMVMLKHCGNADAISERDFQKSGGDTIDVAIEYSPMMCYTYDDTLGGFNYDLLRLIARQQGCAIKFHPVVTLQDALGYLDEGRVDVLVAQYPVTKENRERMLFTDVVYIDKQVLVQRRLAHGGVKINTQLDLAGDTVYVVKGSPMKERIINLSNEIGDSIFVKEESLYGPEQLFLMVASGEIRYAVINRSIAEKLAQGYADVDISTSISFSQIQAWTLAKDNVKLLKMLNAWLRQAKSSPEYSTLREKYGVN